MLLHNRYDAIALAFIPSSYFEILGEVCDVRRKQMAQARQAEPCKECLCFFVFCFVFDVAMSILECSKMDRILEVAKACAIGQLESALAAELARS